MKALLLKIEQHPSAYGRHFYYVFFKSEDGKSYRTCIRPGFENWERWREHLRQGEAIWLDGLRVLKPGMIDADSWPTKIAAPQEPAHA